MLPIPNIFLLIQGRGINVDYEHKFTGKQKSQGEISQRMTIQKF